MQRECISLEGGLFPILNLKYIHRYEPIFGLNTIVWYGLAQNFLILIKMVTMKVISAGDSYSLIGNIPWKFFTAGYSYFYCIPLYDFFRHDPYNTTENKDMIKCVVIWRRYRLRSHIPSAVWSRSPELTKIGLKGSI